MRCEAGPGVLHLCARVDRLVTELDALQLQRAVPTPAPSPEPGGHLYKHQQNLPTDFLPPLAELHLHELLCGMAFDL